MSYLNPITALSAQDNMGGLYQIKVCRKADIVSIPAPADGTIFGNATFKPGAGFISFDVTLDTARMQRQDQLTREGNTRRNSLPFTLPKGRASIEGILKKMVDDEFIVLFFENGVQKMFGQLHAPVQFTYSHDTGRKVADLNAYECRFFYDGPDNVFFYSGTAGNPPVGAAPAVVRLNGTPVASLQGGQILDITSEYGIQYFQLVTT